MRAPRKQRHTARRLYRRILTEFPDAAVAESTVRNHVRERRRPWAWCGGRRSCRRAMAWARRRRSIGTRPGPTSAASGPGCRCSRCARWPAGRRSTAPTCTRRSRRSSRRMSTPSPISAACSACCATTTWPVRCARSCAATGGRRRCGSWRSARTGGLPRSSARPARGTRKAASKAKVGYFRRNHLVPVPAWPTSRR